MVDAAVTVALSETANELRLSIHDDGRGFDPDNPLTNGALGRVVSQDRAELVGGQLVLQSKPGDGTEVRVSICWPEQ